MLRRVDGVSGSGQSIGPRSPIYQSIRKKAKKNRSSLQRKCRYASSSFAASISVNDSTCRSSFSMKHTNCMYLHSRHQISSAKCFFRPSLIQSTDAMKCLLDSMLVLTKQDRLCHVIHATSDPFYQTWLRQLNVMQHCKVSLVNLLFFLANIVIDNHHR